MARSKKITILYEHVDGTEETFKVSEMLACKIVKLLSHEYGRVGIVQGALVHYVSNYPANSSNWFISHRNETIHITSIL